MYRTSQKCLKLCRCVPHGALGGPGMSESTCKERSYSSDWKYDYRLDVLMKKLCTGGCFHSQGRFRGLGGICDSPLEHSWTGKGKSETQGQSGHSYCKSHNASLSSQSSFEKVSNILLISLQSDSPLSSFYLRKGEFIIWSSMAQKCVIYYNSSVFLGDSKLRQKGENIFGECN